MRLDEILSKAGRYKLPKRLGRGPGSGQGKTSGRGHKGLGARAGSGKRLGYEGGQNPVIARSPQRGFHNVFRVVYQVVNVGSLDVFEPGSRVDAAKLEDACLINDVSKPVKILAKGEIAKALTVVADSFSASAKEKIVKAGGTAEQAKA